MKRSIGIIFIIFVVVTSCRTKKENVFIWDKEEDHRQLTLIDDHTFVFQIDAGYYTRMDTGEYQLIGDTILLNPMKSAIDIDSVVHVESLFNEHRFVEVLLEDVTFGKNEVIDANYRPQLFPSVVLNDNLPIQLDPDDPAFHKLLLPDSVEVVSVTVSLVEENSCKPIRELRTSVSATNATGSYQVYISSPLRKANYLAGHKWLIKGNTVFCNFTDDQCTPGAVKLVRKK